MPYQHMDVPKQINFNDCGVYLLLFVEFFFMQPISDFRLPIVSLVNWFEQEAVTGKREKIAHLMRSIIERNIPKATSLPNIDFSGDDCKQVPIHQPNSRSDVKTRRELILKVNGIFNNRSRETLLATSVDLNTGYYQVMGYKKLNTHLTSNTMNEFIEEIKNERKFKIIGTVGDCLIAHKKVNFPGKRMACLIHCGCNALVSHAFGF